MSKLKNPCRLSRRLGCWDNPSGHKTCRSTQWRITGKRRAVTFLIFSAKTESYLENYGWTWGNITIYYHPNFASFINLHPLTAAAVLSVQFTLLCLLQHWTMPTLTIFSAWASPSVCQVSWHQGPRSHLLQDWQLVVLDYALILMVMLMIMKLTDVHETF